MLTIFKVRSGYYNGHMFLLNNNGNYYSTTTGEKYIKEKDNSSRIIEDTLRG